MLNKSVLNREAIQKLKEEKRKKQILYPKDIEYDIITEDEHFEETNRLGNAMTSRVLGMTNRTKTNLINFK